MSDRFTETVIKLFADDTSLSLALNNPDSRAEILNHDLELVEDLCVPLASFVDFPVFFWRVSCEGGFSLLFSSVHLVPVCQNVFLIPLVGLDIPCTIGKDGSFIRRDRSFHLPRIDLARAGRCVTDTRTKNLKCVWMSTG